MREVPGERVLDVVTERVGVLPGAFLRAQVHPRHACAPGRGFADVAARVREQRRAVESIGGAPCPRECLAIAGLGAQLEEELRRRNPLELQAVLRPLTAEERLVNERLVDEVPGVCVELVQVAEAGEETPALEQESRGQRKRPEVRLLDLELVLGRHRDGQAAHEVRIDVGRQRQFRLPEVEAALARSDLVAGRNESCDPVVGGVLRKVGEAATQDRGHRRVERGRARRARRGRSLRHRRRLGDRRSRGRRGGHRRFEFRDARLESGDARVVFRLQCIQLGAERRGVIGRERRGRMRRCPERDDGKQCNRPFHESLLGMPSAAGRDQRPGSVDWLLLARRCSGTECARDRPLDQRDDRGDDEERDDRRGQHGRGARTARHREDRRERQAGIAKLRMEPGLILRRTRVTGQVQQRACLGEEQCQAQRNAGKQSRRTSQEAVVLKFDGDCRPNEAGRQHDYPQANRSHAIRGYALQALYRPASRGVACWRIR